MSSQGKRVIRFIFSCCSLFIECRFRSYKWHVHKKELRLKILPEDNYQSHYRTDLNETILYSLMLFY